MTFLAEMSEDNQFNEESQIFIQVEIPLDFGFKVLYSDEVEIRGRQKSFSYVEVRRNGSVIWTDTNMDAYMLGGEDWFLKVEHKPFILQVRNDRYEIFLPFNNLPSSHVFKQLSIKDDEVYQQNMRPLFISTTPKYLGNDGIKKLAGFWEPVGIGDVVSPDFFSQILYFSITENGFLLDTLLTNKKNEMIFEGFREWKPNDGSSRHLSSWDSLGKVIIERFRREVERIRNL